MAVTELEIDMVGYNFYPQSPRYVDTPLPDISDKIQRIGVFVNASLDTISGCIEKYHLNYAQLHGDESETFVRQVHAMIPVIKVFRIGAEFDTSLLQKLSFCAYFLFDTSSAAYGGSGKKFDWNYLDHLEIKTPYLLSGGIGPEDTAMIRSVNDPYFKGIDINSRFETSPGIKNKDLISDFIQQLRK